MAFDFGNHTNTFYVDTGSNLNNWDWSAVGGTIIVWGMKDADHDGAEFPCMVVKTDVTGSEISRFFCNWTDNSELEFLVSSNGGITLNIVSNNNPFTVSAWNYVAAVWDPTGANGDQHLYRGDLDTTVAECSYATQRVGSLLEDNSDDTLNFGTAAPGVAQGEFDGHLAIAGIWNTQLTLAELKSQQYKQNPVVQLDNLIGWYIFGYHGASALPDLSGNGNNGTTFNGVTVSPHVPLGSAFGFDIGVPYEVAAGGVTVPVMYHHYQQAGGL